VDALREQILQSDAKVRLIQGEPGVGKTWFGCQLAQHELDNPGMGVRSHQKVLFLTFARTAVARIREAFTRQASLDEEKRKHFARRVRTGTFAGFFWWFVESYGRYVKEDGTTGRLWLIGSKRVAGIAIPSGYDGYTFDQLEERSLRLVQIPAVRRLISDVYPLVIVDEFQDVHDRLFTIIEAIGKGSRLALLRGPGQCIYRDLPGREFDPDAILKKCKESLSPVEFFLSCESEQKQRFCREIKSFIQDYDEREEARLGEKWPVRLIAVARKNKENVPNHLESFTNRATHMMRQYLVGRGIGRPMVAILASTNLGVGEIYRTVRKKEGNYIFNETSDTYERVGPQNAAAVFADSVLLQYGRLMLRLFKTHWVARKKEQVERHEISAALALLFQEQDKNANPVPSSWDDLGALLIDRVKRQRKPKNASDWAIRLRRNLATVNGWLRATQSKLRGVGVNECPSTPFDKQHAPLLETLASEFVASIKEHVSGRGKLDMGQATLSFEKASQQRVILEKLGVQKSVQIMTIHKSKGREFDGVVLVLEENPKALWKENSAVLGSEVEDVYRVAISRARSAFALIAFDDARQKAAEPVRRLLPSGVFDQRGADA